MKYKITPVVALVDRSFESFTTPVDPIPVRTIEPGITMLEMYHGRTMAFKDLSMCCASDFMQYFLARRNQRACLLIGRCVLAN